MASDEEIDFILKAVSAVAVNGWKLLPYYRMNIKTGDWHPHSKNVNFSSRIFLLVALVITCESKRNLK